MLIGAIFESQPGILEFSMNNGSSFLVIVFHLPSARCTALCCALPNCFYSVRLYQPILLQSHRRIAEHEFVPSIIPWVLKVEAFPIFKRSSTMLLAFFKVINCLHSLIIKRSFHWLPSLYPLVLISAPAFFSLCKVLFKSLKHISSRSNKIICFKNAIFAKQELYLRYQKRHRVHNHLSSVHSPFPYCELLCLLYFEL